MSSGYCQVAEGIERIVTEPTIWARLEAASPYGVWQNQGDLLAYGMTSLTGLDNKTYSPQQGILNVKHNNFPVSSASIAHPYSVTAWLDWNATDHRGLELMSGTLGTTVSLSITFKPVQSGMYTLVVYRDNKAQSVFSWTGDYTAGVTYNLSGSFSFSTSGQHYYYLNAEGLSDYIYSSPIFLSN